MSLAPGAQLGPYAAVSPLGAGGMGEVYRARDTRLGRDVAIKILPDAFAGDHARVARFEQEARVIAALSHPNILAIFDTGVADEDGPARRLYVVTELLEGETLSHRLASGALPARKATEIAAQIARGLAAAHDKGIVHRDLKPDNVFVTNAGHVKILDFGLARPIPQTERAGSSETRTAITDAGAVLGTVGYMAPEQVRGEPVDARTDLFALGAVLYEMLAGQRAFRRDTAAETMTAILREDPPDLVATRADLPPALDRIVRHCLEKSPAERFQSARDVAFALETLSGSGPMAPLKATEATAPSRRMRERLGWAVVTAALAGAVFWLRATPTPPPIAAYAEPHRATLLLPDGVTLPTDIQPGERLAISPDGARLAFIAAGRPSMLWVQSVNETSARRIEGSEGASAPFWSPDGRIVLFRANDQMMKLDLVEAGRPAAIGPMQGAASWGRTASGEDVILGTFEAGISGVLRRLSPRGGSGSDLTTPATVSREFYDYPSILPDGRHMLFAYGQTGATTTYGFYIAALGSREKKRVAPSSAVDHQNSSYASGYLVSVRNQRITARAFNLDTMTVDSSSLDVAGPVETRASGSAAFSVSRNGVLVYQPTVTESRSRLMVVDRSGTNLRTLADEGEYSNVELSPDGSRVAVSLVDPSARARDIWVVDMARGVRSRVTFDPSNERSAMWSRDGKSLVYTSKGLDLYQKALGVGPEVPFITDGRSKDPRGWSPDGKYFMYRVTGTANNDLWVKPFGGDQKPVPFLATPFDENYAVFSRDGRWLAYASTESGRSEVYVTAFPSGEGKWQISTGGGSFPRWRADGREIVYLSTDGHIAAVPVDTAGATLSVSPASILFHANVVNSPGSPFDMSADGKLFVVNTAIVSKGPPSLVLVYNWPQLLRDR